MAAAREAMTPKEWGMPFQFNRVLDIAPVGWDRMVDAMKEAPTAKTDIAAPYTALEGRMIEQPVEAEGASVLRRRDAAKALIKLDERESGLKSLLKCLRGGS